MADKTGEEIIRILREQFGWEVGGPSYISVPKPKREYVERTLNWVEHLRRFLLETYIIKDSFGIDHNARLDFLEKLARERPEINNWLDANSKLKGNRLQEAIFSMSEIMEGLKKNYGTLHGTLQTIFTPQVYEPAHPVTYNKIDLDAKIAAARNVDRAGYVFLDTLSK